MAKKTEKNKVKNIGIDVTPPKKTCNDVFCPFHGDIKVRGRIFTGVVVQKDMHRSAVIEWQRRFYIHKYERFEKRISRIKVHNPACIDAEIGDEVMVIETRPISKTKSKVIIKNMGKK